MRGLDGRTYIVTGAASGIGLATATGSSPKGGALSVPIWCRHPSRRKEAGRIAGSSPPST